MAPPDAEAPKDPCGDRSLTGRALRSESLEWAYSRRRFSGRPEYQILGRVVEVESGREFQPT